MPILKLVVHFFQKRTLFIVSDPDRTEILKYLQTLHQLSQEYIIDDMAQRIETNIYLQSLSIQSLEHAFDILETVDVITPSKDFRVKDVRDNCARYFMEMLTGYEVLDESLRKRVNNKKNQIDILLNLGDNNTMIVECKTSKDNYSKFSTVSRQIKAYKELVQAAGFSVIKTLLVAPNYTDDFVNDCRDDFELNLSLIEAQTLSNILQAFKSAGLTRINRNLFMRDVLIQEQIVIKGLKR